MKRFLTPKTLVIALASLTILLLLSFGGFYLWSQDTLEAIDVEGIELEEVAPEDGWYVYEAADAAKGLIIYPGAKVEPQAYAYLAQEIAKQGITVAIPSVRLNLVIFDVSKADEIIEAREELDWFISGHSMGGAAAAMYADKNLDSLSGLILLGAYAAGNEGLSASDLPTLSIAGSEDGLSTPAKIEDSSGNLPVNTEFIEIPGGNHAYFGIYGSQSGDNEAQMSVREQQEMIVDLVVEWMKNVR